MRDVDNVPGEANCPINQLVSVRDSLNLNLVVVDQVVVPC
jgi:hypothetical protein